MRLPGEALLACLVAAGCGPRDPAAADPRLATLADARPWLRIRLEPAGAAPAGIVRADLPETVSRLVVEGAAGTVPVDAARLAAWGIGEAEAFALAAANHATTARAWAQVAMAGGAELVTLEADDDHVATEALRLATWPDSVGPEGTLVAIPTRHHCLVHPVRDGRVFPAILALVPLAYRLHARGPDPVSPHLYWHEGGRWHLLRVGVDAAGDPGCTPPPEFVARLARLPAGPGDAPVSTPPR